MLYASLNHINPNFDRQSPTSSGKTLVPVITRHVRMLKPAFFPQYTDAQKTTLEILQDNFSKSWPMLILRNYNGTKLHKHNCCCSISGPFFTYPVLGPLHCTLAINVNDIYVKQSEMIPQIILTSHITS